MASKFQQRHYEAIAEVAQKGKYLADTFAHDPSVTEDFSRGFESGVDYLLNELANVFARDNYLFMRDRFMRACEPGANVKARTK